MPFKVPTIVWVIVHIGLASWAIYHALLYKRDTRAATGWIMISIFVPYAGALAYYFFGINRVRSRAKNLKRGIFSIHYELAQEQKLDNNVMSDPLKGAGHRLTGHAATIGNMLVPLFNGHSAYPEMLEAIYNAEKSILLSTYILKFDHTGKQFINALHAAQSKGVAVKILLDGIGALYSWKNMSRILRKKNLETSLFLPPKLLPPSIYVNLRNHRKLLIIDNKTAYAGGMNISDDHNGDVKGINAVSDVHFSLQGPVVNELTELFMHDWKFSKGDETDYVTDMQSDSHGGMACRVIPDGPDGEMDSLTLTIQAVISAAQQSVNIMTPYFLPSRELMASMQTAALRGVKVRVVLPQKNNLIYIHWANRNLLAELIILGVEIYYQPAPFCHSKLLTVDSDYSLIGSANLDPRSLRLNFELGIEVFSDSLNIILNEHFDTVISDSTMVTYNELANRSVAIRLRDSAAALLSPYL